MSAPTKWQAILFAICALPALAAETGAEILPANQPCLACHSATGLKNHPPTQVDLVKLKKKLLDPAQFSTSNHSSLACTQCHSDEVKTWPHPANTRSLISACEQCHATQVMRFEKQIADSVHGKIMQEPLTCLNCHNPHRDGTARRQKEARKTAQQDNASCLDCHQSNLAMSKASGNSSPRQDLDALHAWLPNTRLHWQAVRCLDCHTESDKKPHAIIAGKQALRQCVSCHSANSTLKTRLYRHQALEEQEKWGFLNSAVLRSAYVVGATRHPQLDRAIMILAGLTVLGVLGHGLLRIIAALWRRNKERRHD